MWKYLAVVLILVLTVSTVLLGIRVRAQNAENERYRDRITLLSNHHEVLKTVVNGSGLRRDSVVAILEHRFPNEEILHLGEGIKIKDTSLSFLGSDLAVSHIHSSYPDWACGPVFGCTDVWPTGPPSAIDSIQDRVTFIFGRYGLALLLIVFAGSVVAFAQQWPAMNRSEQLVRTRVFSGGMVVLSVAILIGGCEFVVDQMLEHGVSSVLVAQGWRIMLQNFLVGMLAAGVLWTAPRIVHRVTRCDLPD